MPHSAVPLVLCGHPALRWALGATHQADSPLLPPALLACNLWHPTFKPTAHPDTHPGATLVPYYLDESQGWSSSMASLQAALDSARAAGKNVRALVIINPVSRA